MAAQEDAATLEALKRAHAAGLVDAGRVALVRVGSDFDRPPPGVTAVECLQGYAEQGGLLVALENLAVAAAALMTDVLTHGF